MGIIDFELLSWGNLLNWQIVLTLGIALAATMAVMLRPRLFWHLLIISAIAGNLPKIKGYTLADEILLGAVVLGGLMVLAVRKREGHGAGRLGLHSIVFMAWMGYLIVQSVRGILVSDDSRLMRWVALYGSLALGVFIAGSPAFRPRSVRQLCITALVATLVTYAVYLLQGIYFERALGTYGRWLSQDQFVAGSATAMFPVVVATPAAIFLIKDRSRNVRILAWASLLMLAAVAYYFDSRVAWLAMAAFFGVSVFKIGVRRIVLALAALSLLSVLFLPHGFQEATGKVIELYLTAEAIWNPTLSDVSRNLQIKAAIATVDKDGSTLLFGYGINVHKFKIAPQIRELFARSSSLAEYKGSIPGSRDDSKATIFRTTAFGAFLIDTGLIGMLLLGLTFAFAALKLLNSTTPWRVPLLAILPVAFLWLLVANIQDSVLLYLLVMPYGLTEQLKPKKAVSPAVKEPVTLVRPVVPGVA